MSLNAANSIIIFLFKKTKSSFFHDFILYAVYFTKKSFFFFSLIFCDFLGLGAYSSSTDDDDSDNENGENSDWEDESVLRVICGILKWTEDIT